MTVVTECLAEEKKRLTTSSSPLGFYLQTIQMNEIESLHCLPPFDHAGDVDLTCTLADHFDVDISLCKGLKHPPCDAHHVRHLFAYEREDSHVAVDGDLIHSYLSALL